MPFMKFCFLFYVFIFMIILDVVAALYTIKFNIIIDLRWLQK